MAEPCPTAGIALWALRRMSSGDVGLQIIKPATKAEACSYVEKLRAQAPRNASPVGRATLFLSHAWRNPFLDLFAAIDSHLTATYGAARAGDQYIWRGNIDLDTTRMYPAVCPSCCLTGSKKLCTDSVQAHGPRRFDLFTLCQHDSNCGSAVPRCDCGSRRTPLSQAQGWLSTSLKTAIHSFKRVLAVLDPWDDPVPLKRSWEYMCALEGAKSGVRLEVVLSPTQERAFHDALRRNFETVLGTLSAVDCRKATAFDKKDERMIFATIEATSFKAGGLNEAVSGHLRLWLEESSLRVLQNTAGPEKLKLQMTVAGFLNEQGKVKEASRLYEQLLAEQIATLGPTHQDTLDTRHNYSINLEAQGRLEEAMEQLVEASKLSRSGGGASMTVAAVNNLASLYLKMGKPKEAAAVVSKALEHDSLRTRGEGDPATLALSKNLGLAYYKLGRLRDAMTVFSQTLAANRRALGNRHGTTVGTMSSLADVYDDMGEIQKAAALHREVLQIYTETLGKTHPDTLGAMGKMGLSLQAQGRMDEAEEYLTLLVGSYERAMGGEHSDTLMCLSNLATVKRDQGKLRESEDLCMRVLAVRRRVLGNDHADTLDSIHNLGNLKYQQGSMRDAEGLYTEELKRRRGTAKTHPDTYTAAYNLSGVYANTGRVLEAERLCMEAYSGLSGALGDSHDKTQSAASLLMQLQQARRGGGSGRSSGRYY